MVFYYGIPKLILDFIHFIQVIIIIIITIFIFQIFFSSVSQNLYCRVMSLNEYRRLTCRHNSERQSFG